MLKRNYDDAYKSINFLTCILIRGKKLKNIENSISNRHGVLKMAGSPRITQQFRWGNVFSYASAKFIAFFMRVYNAEKIWSHWCKAAESSKNRTTWTGSIYIKTSQDQTKEEGAAKFVCYQDNHRKKRLHLDSRRWGWSKTLMIYPLALSLPIFNKNHIRHELWKDAKDANFL